MHRLVYTLLPLLVHTNPILSQALPLQLIANNKDDAGDLIEESSKLYYLITSISLVLLGGVFAGLTLGLMGQDEIYLKVISSSGSPQEQVLAKTVLNLLSRGKHQILVTLLLSNVITNETLPIVLDRLIGEGGGWKAILFSTILIVIFGEIIPQSICVKYGLQIGSWLSPFVTVLMYILWPIAWPIAKLLDHVLGENHGTMYKKSGLKTLVNLHQTNGIERLTQDEVTIITAVLDLKDKFVMEIMTPINKVFTLSSDTVLDQSNVDNIYKSGYSRIPIHLPNDPTNFVGMLLVKILISYDPEDSWKVSQFPLATLPETLPTTSSLNILNYFQQGKSHMCIVSESPGEPLGALGIVTLEDVIEELIGEEIIDESDVIADEDHTCDVHTPLLKRNLPIASENNTTTTTHRSSLTAPSSLSKIPSNLASNPLDVENSFVKIKRNYPIKSSTNSSSNHNLSNYNSHSSLTTNGSNKNMDIDRPSIPMAMKKNKQNENTVENNNGIVESVITIKGVPKTIIQSTDFKFSKQNSSTDSNIDHSQSDESNYRERR
ncbi:hypothetical protein Kpol_1045p47 [Vanderwaltozyma polyspora DSM 70294]|uniref:CNNM transmembrane domain-containing protein n=1 Tax=Vanderwaltozyma polyspora (strain ATCC 22028 / DSM 70294 / BCRC 21397 / CBS 2163 / NBRC 10782 / NRRL Y-8283 / UCD 57-17) TaxID=436907 RepID=A7TI53_VANPO|nr:uncharacterized protein Kpol_1045p47 [Vanderwaltozyma polyspora DSM 70294]EDO18060.1 hypothetical protein Kpol_1045p47 [Vanderwaltozyma polyspora DSM 70294]